MIDQPYILGVVARNELQFPPLRIMRASLPSKRQQSTSVDAVLDVVWGKRRFRFAAACKAYNTPKIIRQAAEEAQRAALAYKGNPLVIAPYLSDEQLKELERQGVSGVDLNGNGVITVPGELLVFRTGNPNQYPQSAPIKNVYQGNSALVPRVLLAQPRYARVGAVLDEIRKRGGSLTLSTVSKVLKSLEEELFVARDEDSVRLIEPTGLLDALQANFRPAAVRTRLIGKTVLAEPALVKTLTDAASQIRAQLVFTGVSSGPRYAVAALEPVLSIYVSQPPEVLLKAARLSFEATDRFPNLEFLWTDEPTVYFDTRIQDGRPFASPAQAYLEMMQGDKRLKQMAEQVKSRILAEARDAETT